MDENNKKIPSPTEVKQIFNEAYNIFYRKWHTISDQEQWASLMQEMREIDNRYNCDLCRQILLELVKVIEDEFLKRRDTDVNKVTG